jgi:RNA polymerase sigma-70 factor, ECF subfamily
MSRVPAADERPDAELVAAAVADPRAFAALYARYLDPVHRYCYRRLGSREAAEDATSLIFMKALAAFPRFHDASFRAWLFTIAHHVVTDRYRAARPEQPLDEALEFADAAPSPEDLALAAETRHDLQALLARLPEHQRRVIELRLAGLSGTEIARVLDRSPNAVAVTHSRAMARLRAMLGQSSALGEGSDGA